MIAYSLLGSLSVFWSSFWRSAPPAFKRATKIKPPVVGWMAGSPPPFQCSGSHLIRALGYADSKGACRSVLCPRDNPPSLLYDASDRNKVVLPFWHQSGVTPYSTKYTLFKVSSWYVKTGRVLPNTRSLPRSWWGIPNVTGFWLHCTLRFGS